jgi:hypothetical protein
MRKSRQSREQWSYTNEYQGEECTDGIFNPDAPPSPYVLVPNHHQIKANSIDTRRLAQNHRHHHEQQDPRKKPSEHKDLDTKLHKNRPVLKERYDFEESTPDIRIPSEFDDNSAEPGRQPLTRDTGSSIRTSERMVLLPKNDKDYQNISKLFDKINKRDLFVKESSRASDSRRSIQEEIKRIMKMEMCNSDKIEKVCEILEELYKSIDELKEIGNKVANRDAKPPQFREIAVETKPSRQNSIERSENTLGRTEGIRPVLSRPNSSTHSRSNSRTKPLSQAYKDVLATAHTEGLNSRDPIRKCTTTHTETQPFRPALRRDSLHRHSTKQLNVFNRSIGTGEGKRESSINSCTNSEAEKENSRRNYCSESNGRIGVEITPAKKDISSNRMRGVVTTDAAKLMKRQIIAESNLGLSRQEESEPAFASRHTFGSKKPEVTISQSFYSKVKQSMVQEPPSEKIPLNNSKDNSQTSDLIKKHSANTSNDFHLNCSQSRRRENVKVIGEYFTKKPQVVKSVIDEEKIVVEEYFDKKPVKNIIFDSPSCLSNASPSSKLAITGLSNLSNPSADIISRIKPGMTAAEADSLREDMSQLFNDIRNADKFFRALVKSCKELSTPEDFANSTNNVHNLWRWVKDVFTACPQPPIAGTPLQPHQNSRLSPQRTTPALHPSLTQELTSFTAVRRILETELGVPKSTSAESYPTCLENAIRQHHRLYHPRK